MGCPSHCRCHPLLIPWLGLLPLAQLEAGRLNGRPCQLVVTEASHADGPRLLYILHRWLPLVLHIRREPGVRRQPCAPAANQACVAAVSAAAAAASRCSGPHSHPHHPTPPHPHTTPHHHHPFCPRSSGPRLCAGTAQPAALPAARMPGPAALHAAPRRADTGGGAAGAGAPAAAAAGGRRGLVIASNDIEPNGRTCLYYPLCLLHSSLYRLLLTLIPFYPSATVTLVTRACYIPIGTGIGLIMCKRQFVRCRAQAQGGFG